MFLAPTIALAATLYIEEDYQRDGMGTYINGIGWAGVLNSQMEGNPIPNGIVCLDVKGIAYKDWSTSGNVYALTAANVTHFRFFNGDVNSTLYNYHKAAWLLGQMYNHKSETAGIQFAIWEIFRPTDFNIYGYGTDLGNLAQKWLNNVNGLTDLNSYDFSSVRIFTPTDTRVQEFMHVHAPIPPTLYLLGAGLAGLVGLRKWFLRKH